MEKAKKEILNHYPKENKKGGVKRTFSVRFFKSLDPAQQFTIIFLRYMLFFLKVDLEYIDTTMNRDEDIEGTKDPGEKICPWDKVNVLLLWFDDLLCAVNENGDHANILKQVHINALESFYSKIVEKQNLKDNEEDTKGVHNELVELIGSHAVYWAEIYTNNISYYITNKTKTQRLSRNHL